VRQDSHLGRVYMAQDGVLVYVGYELGERADGGKGRESAFNGAADALPLEILAVRVVNILGSKRATKREEASLGVLELGG
jgi:hypothetical protein